MQLEGAIERPNSDGHAHDGIVDSDAHLHGAERRLSAVVNVASPAVQTCKQSDLCLRFNSHFGQPHWCTNATDTRQRLRGADVQTPFDALSPRTAQPHARLGRPPAYFQSHHPTSPARIASLSPLAACSQLSDARSSRSSLMSSLPRHSSITSPHAEFHASLECRLRRLRRLRRLALQRPQVGATDDWKLQGVACTCAWTPQPPL